MCQFQKGTTRSENTRHLQKRMTNDYRELALLYKFRPKPEAKGHRLNSNDLGQSLFQMPGVFSTGVYEANFENFH